VPMRGYRADGLRFHASLLEGLTHGIRQAAAVPRRPRHVIRVAAHAPPRDFADHAPVLAAGQLVAHQQDVARRLPDGQALARFIEGPGSVRIERHERGESRIDKLGDRVARHDQHTFPCARRDQRRGMGDACRR